MTTVRLHEHVSDMVISETADQVLARKIEWLTLKVAGLLQPEQFEVASALHPSGIYELPLPAEDLQAGVPILLSILETLTNEEILKYILTCLELILKVQPGSITTFFPPKVSTYPWQPLEKIFLLSSSDDYLNTKCGVVFATLLANAPVPVSPKSESFLINHLIRQLSLPSPSDIRIGCIALRPLLSNKTYCSKLMEMHCLHHLEEALKSHKKSIQIIYDIVYCVWVATFNSKVASHLPTSFLGLIIDVLRTHEQEKVTRICLATLVNLLDKVDNNSDMLDFGLVKVLQTLAKRAWGDIELQQNLQILQEAMTKNITHLSTFEQYAKTVVDGRLEWTPVHRSETFWRENITSFEEKDFKLIKILKNLAQTDKDPVVQAVACHDLGEFARIHPNGKAILNEIGAKELLVQYMTHSNAEIQREALFAVQKLMINKWEFVSR